MTKTESKSGAPVLPTVKAKLLDGKKGLVVGIANDQSIAWGCAKAFRALGAEVAVTYVNDKAKKYVEPLARAVEAPIFMPLDVNKAGQMEAVFERITEVWDNRESHAASLALPEVKAAIAIGRPLIAGFSNRVERIPIGGFGLTQRGTD